MGMVPAWLLIGIAMLSFAAPAHSQAVEIDDFRDTSAWSAHPSDGASLRISTDEGAMRLDFSLRGGSYVIARRPLPQTLPDNYAISFRIRGDAPPNNLELKLIDASGDNVWWRNQRNLVFPREWRTVTIRKRQIEFAWGPSSAPLQKTSSLELAISAGSGGAGTVWIDDLVLTALPPPHPYEKHPLVIATSSATRHPADAALDGDTGTAWRSVPSDSQPSLTIDFLESREYGAIVVDWEGDHFANDYDVEVSGDGSHWENVYRVRNGIGGRRSIYLPDRESRFIRLRVLKSAGTSGVAIREIVIEPPATGASLNAFFEGIATRSPRGLFPRSLIGEQTYWTLVGVDGDASEALISEDGAIEVDKQHFSIEPFLLVDGKLQSWAGSSMTQSLERGDLPIPSVTRRSAGLTLTTTAVAAGASGSSSLHVRYRVVNPGKATRHVRLFLAIRPFQVDPPWQFLNAAGGVATVRSIAYAGQTVEVDEKKIVPLRRPSAFGAVAFDGGDVVADYIDRGVLPPSQKVTDSFEHASAALEWKLELQPGAEEDVEIAVPFHSSADVPRPNQTRTESAKAFAATLTTAIEDWERNLGGASITLPLQYADVVHTLRSNVAWILINRDGPASQPGSRSYERAWIRDGVLMSEALLRLGRPEPAREFLEWYAGFLFPNGKVPCCVDSRGGDAVPENDSSGEFLYGVMEYYRFTRDRAFLEAMWPKIALVVSYVDFMRRQRMTPEYESGARRLFYGLLPESISHEGYSAKAMHSYWDDFWALRGLSDAADAAAVLGKPETETWAGMRDDFRRNLSASIDRSMEEHHIDYVPGAAELGDFDATSTAIAVSPGGELIPSRKAILRTFDRYFENFAGRRDGSIVSTDYTPYELRVVGALVRLGQRDRANAVLEWMMKDRRPPAWNHWAEVVWKDMRAPKFIGDMPHSWVGAEYIRSVLDMFAFERDADRSLVIAAGLPARWVTTGSGLTVKSLATHYGTLDYRMAGNATAGVRASIGGAIRIPGGGIVVQSPLHEAPTRAVVNGTPSPVIDGTVVLRTLPAEVRFEYGP
jgi:hypothetical protein